MPPRLDRTALPQIGTEDFDRVAAPDGDVDVAALVDGDAVRIAAGRQTLGDRAGGEVDHRERVAEVFRGVEQASVGGDARRIRRSAFLGIGLLPQHDAA